MRDNDQPRAQAAIRSPRGRRLATIVALIALLPGVALLGVGNGQAGPGAGPSTGRQAGSQSTPRATAVVATTATPSPATSSATAAASSCSEVLGIGDPSNACVAFVNAVPESDPVIVALGEAGDSSADDVASGGFVDFVAAATVDDLTVQVTVDGASDDVVAEQSFPLEPGKAYVVVLEEHYDEAGSTLVAVPLDLRPTGENASRLTFHHAVTDAADLSVSGLDAPSDGAIGPGETTQPIEVAAGEYEVTVTPANAAEETLATLPLALESDLSYLVIIGGTTGDDTVTVIYAAAPVEISE